MKTTITAAEHGELSEVLQGEYEKNQDGSFHLKLEGKPTGFVAEADHQAFRTNNTNLTEEKKALETKLAAFDGVDIEQYKTLKAAQDDLDKKTMVKAGDIDGIVDAAIEKANKPLRDELEVERSARKASDLLADSSIVDQRVTAAASDFGKIRTGASSVIVTKAKEAGWRRVGDTLLQMKGEDVVGRDIKDWITANAGKDGSIAFCFEPSKGGGGGGADGDETVIDGQKVIPREDREQFRKNLADIASGKTKVADAVA